MYNDENIFDIDALEKEIGIIENGTASDEMKEETVSKLENFFVRSEIEEHSNKILSLKEDLRELEDRYLDLSKDKDENTEKIYNELKDSFQRIDSDYEARYESCQEKMSDEDKESYSKLQHEANDIRSEIKEASASIRSIESDLNGRYPERLELCNKREELIEKSKEAFENKDFKAAADYKEERLRTEEKINALDKEKAPQEASKLEGAKNTIETNRAILPEVLKDIKGVEDRFGITELKNETAVQRENLKDEYSERGISNYEELVERYKTEEKIDRIKNELSQRSTCLEKAEYFRELKNEIKEIDHEIAKAKDIGKDTKELESRREYLKENAKNALKDYISSSITSGFKTTQLTLGTTSALLNAISNPSPKNILRAYKAIRALSSRVSRSVESRIYNATNKESLYESEKEALKEKESEPEKDKEKDIKEEQEDKEQTEKENEEKEHLSNTDKESNEEKADDKEKEKDKIKEDAASEETNKREQEIEEEEKPEDSSDKEEQDSKEEAEEKEDKESDKDNSEEESEEKDNEDDSEEVQEDDEESDEEESEEDDKEDEEEDKDDSDLEEDEEKESDSEDDDEKEDDEDEEDDNEDRESEEDDEEEPEKDDEESEEDSEDNEEEVDEEEEPEQEESEETDPEEPETDNEEEKEAEEEDEDEKEQESDNEEDSKEEESEEDEEKEESDEEEEDEDDEESDEDNENDNEESEEDEKEEDEDDDEEEEEESEEDDDEEEDEEEEEDGNSDDEGQEDNYSDNESSEPVSADTPDEIAGADISGDTSSTGDSNVTSEEFDDFLGDVADVLSGNKTIDQLGTDKLKDIAKDKIASAASSTTSGNIIADLAIKAVELVGGSLVMYGMADEYKGRAMEEVSIDNSNVPDQNAFNDSVNNMAESVNGEADMDISEGKAEYSQESKADDSLTDMMKEKTFEMTQDNFDKSIENYDKMEFSLESDSMEESTDSSSSELPEHQNEEMEMPDIDNGPSAEISSEEYIGKLNWIDETWANTEQAKDWAEDGMSILMNDYLGVSDAEFGSFMLDLDAAIDLGGFEDFMEEAGEFLIDANDNWRDGMYDIVDGADEAIDDIADGLSYAAEDIEEKGLIESWWDAWKTGIGL